MPRQREVQKPGTPTSLNKIKIITSTAATYPVLDTDFIVMFTTTVNVSVLLPPVAVNRQLFFKQLVKGLKVNVTANGTETIDGASVQTIRTQYDTMFIFCDETAWYIV